MDVAYKFRMPSKLILILLVALVITGLGFGGTFLGIQPTSEAERDTASNQVEEFVQRFDRELVGNDRQRAINRLSGLLKNLNSRISSIESSAVSQASAMRWLLGVLFGLLLISLLLATCKRPRDKTPLN
ncbi:MAG: hypothetical protein ABIT37_04010 [Luteolibacter sp.]